MIQTSQIQVAFDREWIAARSARRAGNLDRAFDHRELVGQSTRVVAALLFSRLWVPIGNTGGANVSAFRPMPVPDDLRAILDAERSEIV